MRFNPLTTRPVSEAACIILGGVTVYDLNNPDQTRHYLDLTAAEHYADRLRKRGHKVKVV